MTALDKDYQHKEEPGEEAQMTSPDKRHVHEEVVDEEAQGTGSDKSHLHEEELDEEAQEMTEARVIIYDVYRLAFVSLRYLIQYHLSADTGSDLFGLEMSSLGKGQEDLPDVLMGQLG
jgi:hypothetical protein